MTIASVTAAECVSLTEKALDLGEHELYSVEGLAASLRRAASFRCPATPRAIVEAVLDGLRPLRPDATPTRNDLEDLLDLLVSSGDLVELPPSGDRGSRMLYLGPPAYVELRLGLYRVMGIRPYGAPLIGSAVSGTARLEQHTRTIELNAARTDGELRAAGLHPVSRERWIAEPGRMQPGELVAEMASRLDVAGRAGGGEGLTVLDSANPVGYYRGRWRSLRPEDGGDYVARRPQEYGADIWCYVRVAGGVPVRLADFPVDDPTSPGRDGAWRLQAAIDATRDQAHSFRIDVDESHPTGRVVDLLTPLPTWAQRYLELVGRSIPRRAGALISYSVPTAAVPDLSTFLAAMLWMRADHMEGTE